MSSNYVTWNDFVKQLEAEGFKQELFYNFTSHNVKQNAALYLHKEKGILAWFTGGPDDQHVYSLHAEAQFKFTKELITIAPDFKGTRPMTTRDIIMTPALTEAYDSLEPCYHGYLPDASVGMSVSFKKPSTFLTKLKEIEGYFEYVIPWVTETNMNFVDGEDYHRLREENPSLVTLEKLQKCSEDLQAIVRGVISGLEEPTIGKTQAMDLFGKPASKTSYGILPN